MLAQHQEATDSHAAGVDARGDHAMGFPDDKSAHHVRLYPDGGAIEVVANDPNDTATHDEIRVHLNHIVQLFMAGDFQVPMAVAHLWIILLLILQLIGCSVLVWHDCFHNHTS